LWIEGKIFPHRLRHTFATMLLSKNAEIFYIQKLLWHKNFSTTEEYLTVLNETAKKTQSLLDGLFKK
jgi:site-specific recombinase XerD